MEILDELFTLKETTKPKGLVKKIKSIPALVEFINTFTAGYEITFVEKVWCTLNQTLPNKCKNENIPAFKNLAEGYRKFCGDTTTCSCRNNSHSTKMKAVWDKRTPEEKAKFTASVTTMNSPEIQAKAASTNLMRYGAEKPFQSDQIRKKAAQSYLNNTGFDSPLHNPTVQKKIQDTTIAKYGGLMTHARKAAYKKFNENPFSNRLIREKIKETMFAKYGVEFPSQDPEIRQRIVDTNLQRYNCTNPAQMHYSEEVKQVLNVSDLFVEKYQNNGLQWFINGGMSPGAVRSKLIDFGVLGKRQSMPEEFIQSVLFDNNIQFTPNTRSIIPPLELDFYLPEFKIAIEVNGIYWHSEISGKKDKKYHSNKFTLCKDQGIQLLQFWDIDIIDNPHIVENKIKQLLGINTRIYARSASVIQLSKEQEREFFDSFHFQGYSPSKECYGLVYNGEVVAAMSFTKPRFNKNYQWELLRFACKTNHTIVGGASKLFSKFVKVNSPESVVSYSDRRVSLGKLYNILGFSYILSSTPGYHYTSDYKSLSSRVKYQKHKLSKLLPNFDPTLTEWQNMQLNGFDRVWDCGMDTWVWNRK
jgi:very-short-patch-repair endonuclease